MEHYRAPASPVAAHGSSLALPLTWVVLAVTAAAIVLRLPSLAEPIGIDQGIFATAGMGLTRGLRLYVDLWDQKPPGIHLTYALGILLFGARPTTVVVLDWSATAITALGLWTLTRRLGDVTRAWLVVGLWLAGTLPAARFAHGGFLERAVPEVFITPLVTGAVLSIASYRLKASVWSAIAMGSCIGAAAAFKPTAWLYGPLFLALMCRGRQWRARHVAGSLLAMALPVVTLGIWLYARGALSDALTAVVEYNKAYVQAAGGPQRAVGALARELYRLSTSDPLWFLALASWLVSRLQRQRDELRPLAEAWLVAAVCAALANGARMFPSYLIPATPALALLASDIFRPLSTVPERQSGRQVLALALALTIALGLSVRHHYFSRLWRSTRSDVMQLSRNLDPLAYLDGFGGYASGRGYSARANAELVAYLNTHATEHTLYIVGMAPSVYFESGLLPANRFLWSYPALSGLIARADFTAAALAADLETARPQYIVLEHNNRDSLTGWTLDAAVKGSPIEELLRREYQRALTIKDFEVFQRRDVSAPDAPLVRPHSSSWHSHWDSAIAERQGCSPASTLLSIFATTWTRGSTTSAI